jgi:hypothetical protein
LAQEEGQRKGNIVSFILERKLICHASCRFPK